MKDKKEARKLGGNTGIKQNKDTKRKRIKKVYPPKYELVTTWKEPGNVLEWERRER